MTGKFDKAGLFFFAFINIAYVIGCLMWNVPMDKGIAGFLGAMVFAFATWNLKYQPYHAGTIEVEHRPDGAKLYSLSLDDDPEDLDKKKRVIFDVEAPRD